MYVYHMYGSILCNNDDKYGKNSYKRKISEKEISVPFVLRITRTRNGLATQKREALNSNNYKAPFIYMLIRRLLLNTYCFRSGIKFNSTFQWLLKSMNDNLTILTLKLKQILMWHTILYKVININTCSLITDIYINKK